MITQDKAILLSQYAELGTNECVFAREEAVEISYPVWYPDAFALDGYTVSILNSNKTSILQSSYIIFSEGTWIRWRKRRY